jgi:hypothetical protein
LRVLKWEQIEHLPEYVSLGSAFAFVGRPEGAAPRSGLFTPQARKVLSRMTGPVSMPALARGAATFPRHAAKHQQRRAALPSGAESGPGVGRFHREPLLRVVAPCAVQSNGDFGAAACGSMNVASERWNYAISRPGNTPSVRMRHRKGTRAAVSPWPSINSQPLVAELLHCTALSDGQCPAVRSRLASFGIPVEGSVHLEVADRGLPGEQIATVASHGNVVVRMLVTTWTS